MRIIDVVTYNGEVDLLNLRHEILKDCVDEFIVVQAPTTFTGKKKPIYEVPEWATSYVIDENYTKEEIELAENSPNTLGASHWKHEFLQKESIKKALTHLDDEDIVFIGDVDEIWDPKWLDVIRDFPGDFLPFKLPLRVYTYYLDNRSSESFSGTVVAPYGVLKNRCFNHVRSTDHVKVYDELWGWHFTSMGGYEALKKKLTDQYTHETYANKWVMDNLEKNMRENKDFLGRNFEFRLDTSEWPEYLKEHKEEYRHLMRC